jgi:Nucleotide-diphospho-sugar transferase
MPLQHQRLNRRKFPTRKQQLAWLIWTVLLSLVWLGLEILVSVLIQRSVSSPTLSNSVTMRTRLSLGTNNNNNSKPVAVAVVGKEWPPPHIVDAWMDNQRRVVVAATNAEYVDFMDNFAQSLLSLKITNFILIALDPLAYHRLTNERSYGDRTIPFYDELRHTTEEAVFGNPAFRQLTSTRPRFLRPFLQANYTVFYNDIDVVWRQNAWDALTPVVTASAGNNNNKPISTIVFGDGPSQLCTCLMYLTPNAIDLVDEWMAEIQNGSHETDQFAFIDVCKRRNVRFRGGQTDQILVIRFDPRFPTGKEYNWTIPKDATTDPAVIVHNNWIKGKQAKLERFQSAGLWHPSQRATS